MTLKLASPPGTEYVFATRTGTPRDQANVSRDFKATRERAKVEDAKFHWFRHTHVSELIAAGWDVTEIARRVGDSETTLMKTYAHEFDAARREGDQRKRLADMQRKAS